MIKEFREYLSRLRIDNQIPQFVVMDTVKYEELYTEVLEQSPLTLAITGDLMVHGVRVIPEYSVRKYDSNS